MNPDDLSADIWLKQWEIFGNDANSLNLGKSQCLTESPTNARGYLIGIWLYIEEYRIKTNILKRLSLDDSTHEIVECDKALHTLTSALMYAFNEALSVKTLRGVEPRRLNN